MEFIRDNLLFLFQENKGNLDLLNLINPWDIMLIKLFKNLGIDRQNYLDKNQSLNKSYKTKYS